MDQKIKKIIKPYIPDMTLTDCMCQKKKGGRGIYCYQNSIETTTKRLHKIWLLRQETMQRTQTSKEQNNQKIKIGKNTLVWTFQTTQAKFYLEIHVLASKRETVKLNLI